MAAISIHLDHIHRWARSQLWLGYFAIFIRVVLAFAFIAAGIPKVTGERFTALAINHPMGHYLESLYYTGFYYPFIGIMQLLAAMLLLIPRMATLGATLYFPIILNIAVLTFATRFDGSLLTAPLMVLANVYLLFWDYHKFRLIFPWNARQAKGAVPDKITQNRSVPWLFFTGVAIVMVAVVFTVMNMYELMPRNSLADCVMQCGNELTKESCLDFCECIHTRGETLDDCLDDYKSR